jgi:hypothetical protein
MLKQADFIAKKATVESLPSTAFAWEDERRFPVHTKEDTVASLLYRSKLGSAVPAHVDQKLEKAATVFGVKHAVAAPKVASAQVKLAYALPDAERLPINSKSEVLVAEHVLTRDHDKLPLEKRAEAFSNLTTAAKAHGVELSPFSLKMAGLTVSNTAVMRDWLEARAAATTGKYQAAFDKLASELSAAPATISDRKQLIKIASVIGQLDEKAGLNKFYDRKLPDPLQTVFNTEKLAEEMCDVSGAQMPVSALMGLPEDVWESVDMPELAQLAASGDAAQFKAAFDTVPLDVKMVLRRQLGG